jgi:hypothetical protein
LQSIKCKHERKIIKKLIDEHNLEQSMLRFARIYRCHDGSLLRDQMKESRRNQLDAQISSNRLAFVDYGNVSIIAITPSDGPMDGGTEINVAMQGMEADDRDKVSIIVWENNTPYPIPPQDVQWNEQIASFEMPACQWPQDHQVDVNIRIYHNEKELGGSTHKYSQARRSSRRIEN